MKFPWLILLLVCIPMIVGITYIQKRRWQPSIDDADARIAELKRQINIAEGRCR